MTKPISNNEDIIDSRDIIERIDELTAEREALQYAASEATSIADSEPNEQETALNSWDEDYGEELNALLSLAEQADGTEWKDGATLIRDSYFEDYARELAEDVGAISEKEQWPLTCIDWERAADELQQDYTSVDFDGVEYWVR